MKIGLDNFKALLSKKPAQAQEKRYLCWRCGKDYTDPKDYLWHIQYC